MGAAVTLRDVVGEAEDVSGVGIIPLHGDLNIDAVNRLVKVDDVLVDYGLVEVEVLDELPDSALVMEHLGLAVELVLDGDPDA